MGISHSCVMQLCYELMENGLGGPWAISIRLLCQMFMRRLGNRLGSSCATGGGGVLKGVGRPQYIYIYIYIHIYIYTHIKEHIEANNSIDS